MPTAPDPRPDGIHPCLLDVFAILDDSGGDWLLLRGEEDLGQPTGDVDLLVSPALRRRLDRLLLAGSFVRVAAPGHGGHRFYFRYSDRDGSWIKLDIVSSLRFGKYQQLHLPLAGTCLAQRVRNGPLWLPARSDKAWLYLLHLLLDKGGIPRDRVPGAVAAAADATLRGPLPTAVDQLLGAGSAEDILALLREGRSSDGALLSARLRASAARRHPLAWAWRSLAGIVLRRVPPTVQGVRRRGVTIGVMGPDGAGKTSLLSGLEGTLPVPARYVHLGIWSGSSGRDLLERIPGRRLGTRAVRILKAAGKAHYARLRGTVVLVDRVPHDTQLPGSIDPSFGGRVCAALAFATLPTPDVLFTLDAPGEIMFARKREHSVEQLETWRKAYLDLARTLPGSYVLDATRTPEVLRRQAAGVVWRALAGRPSVAPREPAAKEAGHA